VIEQRELALGETFVGTVMAKRTSTVGSRAEGRVLEFLVDEGDHVTEGHPMAVLRTTMLHIELEAANAELQLRQHELAELENGSRPEEIAQAEARMKAARALSDYADASLRRAESLHQRNAISENELQEKVSAAKGASEAHIEAVKGHELAVK